MSKGSLVFRNSIANQSPNLSKSERFLSLKMCFVALIHLTVSLWMEIFTLGVATRTTNWDTSLLVCIRREKYRSRSRSKSFLPATLTVASLQPTARHLPGAPTIMEKQVTLKKVLVELTSNATKFRAAMITPYF